MKNILEASFMKDMCSAIANMYRLGWDERNGGNVSYLLYEEDVAPYLDTKKVLRTIPMDFEAPELIGKYFLITGTGKYFKNVQGDPEANLGIIRVAQDAKTAELMWGWCNRGQFTSELPAHLMSHTVRLRKDPEHRIVMHTHPTNILAMTHVHEMTDKSFTRTIWGTCTECIVVFPDGIGTLPWMVCGTNEIGIATAKKMEEYRLVVWTQHGIYGTGKDMDETFGLIETVEKGAELWMKYATLPIVNRITDAQLDELAQAFGLTYRTDFLDL